MDRVLRDCFDHALAAGGQMVAVEFTDRTITYRQLDGWANAVAAQLTDLGVRAGSAVAIYVRNCPEFFAVDVAIARLGAVKVPINFMLPSTTVAHCLRTANVEVVVTDPSLHVSALVAIAETSREVRLVLTAETGERGSDTEILVGSDSAAGGPVPRPEGLNEQSPAAIYFTGGTTGVPKGVLHNQSSLVAFHYAQLIEAEILEDERLLLTTPLAHAAGLFGQSGLIRGATLVLRDGFDMDDTVGLIQQGRITWMFLVPTMIYRLLDRLDGSEIQSAVRTIVYGAAPIAPPRLAQGLEVFGRVFIQLYAQTESPNWGTRLGKRDHDLDRTELLVSCGRPSLLADVKIVDDGGDEVPRGTVGEICLRTPYMLDEYIGNPAATAEKFLNDWIRTGDIGMMDENEYVYLLDRKSDMVISGGLNVYCKEVEDVLVQHPAVKHAAVIGIPDPDWGEAVHAVLVTDHPDADTGEIIEWTRGRLAAYARPKSAQVIDSLPETPFGKVDKKALRAPYWAERTRAIG